LEKIMKTETSLTSTKEKNFGGKVREIQEEGEGKKIGFSTDTPRGGRAEKRYVQKNHSMSREGGGLKHLKRRGNKPGRRERTEGKEKKKSAVLGGWRKMNELRRENNKKGTIEGKRHG